MMNISLKINNLDIATRGFTFPGGERQIIIPKQYPRVNADVKIIAKLKSSNDIIDLLLLTDAIRRELKSHSTPIVSFDVMIPYLPYSRQDRVCVAGESFSLKVFCDLINSQRYDSVTIIDPHSDVSQALIDNCKVIKQSEIIQEFLCLNDSLEDQYYDYIIAPDAGAYKKIFDIASIYNISVITANKVRDLSTGEILKTEFNRDAILLDHQKGLIIDDICDGGRTFIELSKVLRQGEVFDKVDLFVTHGIFSRGLGVFENTIDKIYTTDSIHKYINIRNDYLEVFSL